MICCSCKAVLFRGSRELRTRFDAVAPWLWEKSLVEEDPGIRLTRLPCFERTDRLMVGLRRIVNADS
jgi:hypothetical protein